MPARGDEQRQQEGLPAQFAARAVRRVCRGAVGLQADARNRRGPGWSIAAGSPDRLGEGGLPCLCPSRSRICWRDPASTLLQCRLPCFHVVEGGPRSSRPAFQPLVPCSTALRLRPLETRPWTLFFMWAPSVRLMQRSCISRPCHVGRDAFPYRGSISLSTPLLEPASGVNQAMPNPWRTGAHPSGLPLWLEKRSRDAFFGDVHHPAT